MTEGNGSHTRRPRRTSRKPEPGEPSAQQAAAQQPAGGEPRADAASQRAAPEDWAAIGTIVGAFGIHGDLKVQPLTDFPERFEHTPTVYVGAAHTPRRVASARIHGRLVIVHLEGVETATDAQKLRGDKLSIPSGELLALPQDAYYLHDLIGLRVVHVDGTPLGEVTDVLTGGGNDLFVIREPSGGEVLLPAVKEFVKSVDIPGGVIRVAPIPGLFDDRAAVAEPGEPEEELREQDVEADPDETDPATEPPT